MKKIREVIDKHIKIFTIDNRLYVCEEFFNDIIEDLEKREQRFGIRILIRNYIIKLKKVFK